jgi:phage gpG-like protein
MGRQPNTLHIKMTINIKVDATKAKQKLGATKKKVVVQQAESLKDAALLLVGEVKLSIAGRKPEPKSVDTGRFLNSINIASLTTTEAVVGTNIKYAEYLEYGTSFIKPRRHFQNSLKRNRKNINKSFAINISSVGDGRLLR